MPSAEEVEPVIRSFRGRKLPNGAQGTVLAISVLFVLALALAIVFRKPFYWFFGVAAIYAIVLLIDRRRKER